MRAVLGNVEEMARDYPGFEAPPVEYREGLQPGDLAELMFLSERVPEGRWAEVTEVPQPGWYRGILDSGEWIDFGPEHVADLKTPSPQMGVTPFGHFGSGRMPEKKPSIWDWEDRALWVEAQRKKEEAARAAKGLPPKQSFWDWIRRKKTAPAVTPIPETERRAPPVPRGLLPAPVEIFEEPPAPSPSPRPGPPPPKREPEAPQPTIIVPPAPSSPGPGEIIVPEEGVRHEEPISYFDILGPSTEAPPAPKEERGIILLPPGPAAPLPPTGLVPAAPTDVFSVLAPGPVEPSPPPGGLIIPEEGPRAPAVAQADVFEILAPTAPPSELTPFDVLGPSGGMVVAPPSAPATPFDVLVPEAGGMVVAPPPGEVTAFDVLTPASGMVVAPPVTPFDVLAPEGPGGLAPYVAPQELSPFEVVAPAPAGPGWGGWGSWAGAGAQEETEEEEKEEEEEERRKKKKKKKKIVMSLRSSTEDWEDWIEREFDLEDLWDHIRSTREDEWHRHFQAHEEGSGLPATIRILTVSNGDWEELFDYLDIPYSEVSKYVEAVNKEMDDVGGYDEAWEEFNVKVIDKLSDKIDRAFKALKPKDIKGHFSIGEDGKTEGQAYGLVYYERMSDAERGRILDEEMRRSEQERREYEQRQQMEEQAKKGRMAKLRRIWGRLPEPEDLESWVDRKYDERFWQRLIKQAKSKGFQEEKEEAAENGEYGVMELEAIAQDDDNLYEQLGAYFGIPPDVFSVYLDGSKPEDEAVDELWDEVLRPYFQVAGEAMNRAKPRSLPGWIEFGWDDEEWQFWLKYFEE